MVDQQMASLAAYGLPLYPRYSHEERRMHFPQREWTVTLGGRRRELVLR